MFTGSNESDSSGTPRPRKRTSSGRATSSPRSSQTRRRRTCRSAISAALSAPSGMNLWIPTHAPESLAGTFSFLLEFFLVFLPIDGRMKRGPDGSFDDDELAKILQDATATTAGAYRARGTPSALRAVEIMGIMQGRQWGVCSMNEFRQFLGLKKFTTFEEWSTEPGVAVGFRVPRSP